MEMTESSGYRWASADLGGNHDYLLPAVLKALARVAPTSTVGASRGNLFELGCGNGSVANVLAQMGWNVSGIDPSTEGIAQANAQHPHLNLYAGSAYDDLATRFGQFPIVTSLESWSMCITRDAFQPRCWN